MQQRAEAAYCFSPIEMKDEPQSSASSVYVFVVSQGTLKRDDGEPIGQVFESGKEAAEWILKQPVTKKFVVLRVTNGGAQTEAPA